MKRVSYHTHTTISDGKITPEKLIKLAIKNNYEVLALTDHYRNPPGLKDWGNDYYSDEDYLELKRLKKKYKDKIKILVGVEFDWIPGYEKWILEQINKRKYDITLISIHFLKIKNDYDPIEYTEEYFKEMIKKIGGIKKLVRLYYKTLRAAIKTKKFDVVAHPDLIKSWNKDSKYFSENEAWYKKEIINTLNQIKKTGMKIDLNLKGARKPCGELHPSKWVIDEIKSRKIKMLIGTDAHRGELNYKKEDLNF
jgi:histidinol-phosphatase (PHP family)